MKILIFSFIVLVFISCSHQSNLDTQSTPERSVASEAFEVDSFLESLNRTIRIFPHLGNPRFYLFEHFANRSKTLIDSSNDQNESRTYLSLWASHKVMTDAGIYLNFSFLVNQDSLEVLNSLQKIDVIMADLKMKLNHQFRIEDEESTLKVERKLLIQSLAKRIGRDFKLFVKNERDQLFVQSFLNSVKALRNSSLEIQYSMIISDPKYKKTRRLLSNLSLMDNGHIDGADESYEKVMSVQMSAELIHWLFERELRN